MSGGTGRRGLSSRRPTGVGVLCLVVASLTTPMIISPAHGSDDGSDAGATATEPRGPAQVAAPLTTPEAAYHPEQVLVRFSALATELDRAGVRTRHELTKISDLPLPGLELVGVAEGSDPADVAAAVTSEPLVEYAEPDHLWSANTVGSDMPDDPDMDRLWGLHNTGQDGGHQDADIDAPEAWTSAASSHDVVVAVIDTGMDVGHPDLAASVWVNPGESGVDGDGADRRSNGRDDDGNGFVDDVHGWDFGNDDATVFDDPVVDAHGTHVAGTIAGVRGNGADVSGVSGARLMSIKFLSIRQPNGGVSGWTSDAISAIDYAIRMHADVSNNSWGGAGRSRALQDKIAEAGQQGQLFIAAAGNDGRDNDDMPMYPASYDLANIISVAASDRHDELAWFSNHGETTVDLAAPGHEIVSTVPRTASALVVGPETSGINGRISYHTFGLEGVVTTDAKGSVMAAALAATKASGPILVVDDDEGDDAQEPYVDVLRMLGHEVVVHEVPQSAAPPAACSDGPTDELLLSYPTVVWLTGADYQCTMTPADQLALTTYVLEGNALVLFSTDLGYHLTQDGALVNAFYDQVLRAEYLVDYDLSYRAHGLMTPYDGLEVIELHDEGPWDQMWSDRVAPQPGASLAMEGGRVSVYSGTSMAAPHVTGAVAVLIANRPELDATQLKDQLLTHGDIVDALLDRTWSGTRLNLATALTAPYLGPARRPTVASITDASSTEGATTVVVPIELREPAVDPVELRFRTVDATATATDDYMAAQGEITIPAGEVRGELELTLVDDAVVEGPEAFTVELTASDRTFLRDGLATVTILDDETLAGLTIDDVVVDEATGTPVTARFGMRLSEPVPYEVEIGYQTRPVGGARADEDYRSTMGSVRFAPGETLKVVEVVVVGDRITEPQEAFVLDLSAPAHVALADVQGRATIVDDDPEPVISLRGTTAYEGFDGIHHAQVVLDRPSARFVYVYCDTRDGTAQAGADYVPLVHNPLRICASLPPGATMGHIALQLTHDLAPEPQEAFFVRLTGAINGTVPSSPPEAEVTIEDDDANVAEAVLAVSDSMATEAGRGTLLFWVTLSRPTVHPVTFRFRTVPGTAWSDDYRPLAGVYELRPGATRVGINVLVSRDGLDEHDEALTFEVTEVSGARTGRPAGVGTIVDSDEPPIAELADVKAPEGDAGVAAAGVPLSLSEPSGRALQLTYRIMGASAAVDDAVIGTGTVTVPAGEIATMLPVELRGDILYEGDEQLLVELDPDDGIALGRPAATLTIVEDDPLPLLRVLDAAAAEGTDAPGAATFELSLSHPSANPIAIHFATLSGTASAGIDYHDVTGAVELAPGSVSATVTVPYHADRRWEADETFTLTLAGEGPVILERAGATGVILDDDFRGSRPPPRW